MLSVAALVSVIPPLLRFFNVPPDPIILALSTAIFLTGLAAFGAGPILGLLASVLLGLGVVRAASVLFLFATVFVAITTVFHLWSGLSGSGNAFEILLWLGVCGGFVVLTRSARRLAGPIARS